MFCNVYIRNENIEYFFSEKKVSFYVILVNIYSCVTNISINIFNIKK